ncbi:putrescine-ornithine antiporter [Veillonella caviae]|uniref:putrescine-ornithine antiporter n=1 Tax=Veillonella caviae TaxID=248316 RepID=UPI0023F7873F|nr:putrescine-ornithine antiporter [Veillonella caviae]MCF0157945.1 putrescine-ornithine antiporter [Veillonella sp.]MDY5787733.1 putrescine-ornithine antiporter [Veillonella caviae]
MKTTAKKMSVFQLTTMVAANMLGAGIIMLPTNLAQVGTISVLSWLVTAVGALLLAYIFAQAGMFSQIKGGMGGYTEHRFGKTGHFMASYAYSISLIIANVAIAVSAVGYGAELFGIDLNAVQTSQVTIVLLWFAAILNFKGNRFTGQLSNITVWGSIIPVFAIGTIGWFWFNPDMYIAAWNPNDLPFFDAVKQSISLTLWAFLGFESAAANADAVENPKKNVPIATVAGTLAVAVIYVLSTNVMAGIVPNADLLNSNAPFGLTYMHMFNSTVANIVMASMVISCCGALLCWQFTLSRVFKSAAEAGYFPKVFARVNSKDAPVRGVLILLVVETVLTLFTANDILREQFEMLVNLAVVTNVVPYILCTLAVPVMMRQSGLSESRIKNFNIIAVFGVMYCIYAIYACGVDAIVGGVVALAIGFVIYIVRKAMIARRAHNLQQSID